MKYHGAGSIIFTTKRGIICALLPYDISRKQYNDFGGKKDHKHKDVIDTAQQELFEESGASIYISKKYFKYYVNVKIGKGFYRFNFLKINDIKIKKYFDNIKVLKRNGAPKYWIETNDLRYVPVKNLLKNSKYVKDINGEKIKLNGRIRIGIKHGKHIISKIIKRGGLNGVYRKNKKKSYLKNTETLYIK